MEASNSIIMYTMQNKSMRHIPLLCLVNPERRKARALDGNRGKFCGMA
jgi:hypothetical protein